MRAYVNLPKLRGGSVRGWLYRVALNAGHDVLRRGMRRPEDPLERGDGKIIDLPDPALGPDAVAEGRERARVVREALLALPADYREAVVLRDVNQLSYEEIAEALRVPLGDGEVPRSAGRGRCSPRGSAATPRSSRSRGPTDARAPRRPALQPRLRRRARSRPRAAASPPTSRSATAAPTPGTSTAPPSTRSTRSRR